MKNQILTLSIAVALTASSAWSQQPGGRPPQGQGAPPNGDKPQREPRPPGHMPMPFLHALDTDEDGILSADEIKAAPDSLKKLDKNQDGQLTRDEWQPKPPAPPEGGEGQGQVAPGPRDGTQRKTGPRDGERPHGGARDGARKPGGTADGKPPIGGDKPAGDRRQGPPPPQLIEALDADHDGTISADEIEKAAESLATLDKNNDGQLGPREYGPRPPEGRPPEEGGQSGEKPEPKPAQ